MEKHEKILKEYLELVLSNLSTYEERLKAEAGGISTGEAAYISKKRREIEPKLTELRKEEDELTKS